LQESKPVSRNILVMGADPSKLNTGPKPIGEILIEKGLITREQLDQALAVQKDQPGEKLGIILVSLGFVSLKDVTGAYAEQVLMMYDEDDESALE
jgi:hypothetical protein